MVMMSTGAWKGVKITRDIARDTWNVSRLKLKVEIISKTIGWRNEDNHVNLEYKKRVINQ